MRIIAFILSMVIFTSSLNASNFVKGVAMLYSSHLEDASTKVDACCSVKVLDSSESDRTCTSSIVSQEHDHAKGFCNGVNCDCKCCGHIVYVQPALDYAYAHANGFKESFKFLFEYRRDFVAGKFIPPNRS